MYAKCVFSFRKKISFSLRPHPQHGVVQITEQTLFFPCAFFHFFYLWSAFFPLNFFFQKKKAKQRASRIKAWKKNSAKHAAPFCGYRPHFFTYCTHGKKSGWMHFFSIFFSSKKKEPCPFCGAVRKADEFTHFFS